ncbi:flagellar hook-associated protein FlgK [Rubellimicrobium aerolatum]|uniref:Flagellar hook-associated protein 1 n=1 Tax=Rubellimicrobium aerolatum TaxID=490979 RepID=A0ABW0S9V2_9RHOB|nr:flagellar hook-associated protein FlgK [Rubellimicrobium aerolatum]MBP1805091.1 flagellar hook-associated protein 1 FlgK [Rubellimicrobium aerolatum]
MSLSTAFGNALSGLGAASRMSEVVASNLANALTEGYARRSVELSSLSVGGRGMGVRVDGIARHVNTALLAERRSAEGTLAGDAALAGALRGLEDDLGSTDAGTSLAARIQAVEEALVSASADPSSDTRLSQVMDSLGSMASTLNQGAATVQQRREEADASIATQVGDLNAALQGLAQLNVDIVRARAIGVDAAGLLDQQGVLLDKVATMVPIRQMERTGGAIALITPQGATLLDGSRAATVGFVASPTITGAMAYPDNLQGLTLNGKPVGGDDGVGALSGGSLGAAFVLRDETLPAVADTLDLLARDLLDRFADADPTLGASDAGLLTDAQGPASATTTSGLARRLAVNTAAAGDPTLLRDGLGASTPADPGDSTQIGRWIDALAESRPLTSGGSPGSSAALAAEFVSDIGARRLSAEQKETYSSARWSTLRSSELAGGVDSDQEAQMLLQIEKAYAANARVISALDNMMQTILEI